jgi:hypothetical protein
MSWMHGLWRSVVLTLLILGSTRGVNAATYDLPLNGTVVIVGDLPTSYNPSSYGPVGIEIQALQNFSLPVFNTLDPSTTAGVYQWIANFSVLNQSGMPIAEPDLSPFGTALTGYGQNCSVSPYCSAPSGGSSDTVLSGQLFVSDQALTLKIVTSIYTLNVPSYDLDLQLTLPDGLSITPVPTALPLFIAGLAIMGFLAWRSRQHRANSHRIELRKSSSFPFV